MNNYNYIIKLLNFQDKNIQITKIDYVDNVYYIYASQLKDYAIYCPECGGVSITKRTTYIRTIKHTPINGYPCFIKLPQIRYKCNYCKKSFNQSNSLVIKGCYISNQTKNEILNESKYKQSFKDVSKRTNVSQTTVSNEFKKNIHDYRCHLSRIICFDEFKVSTTAGKYDFFIGDPESGEILDILPSRLQDYIYHYFNTIPCYRPFLNPIEPFVKTFFGKAFI